MRTILIQLDVDPQPSVFDRVVAIDAGAEEVISYGNIKTEQVRDIVHGAIFTRGPRDLKNTAIFVGGSDVTAGELLLEEVRKHMLPQFGLSVSAMLDASGANTTAVAAVMAAARHLDLTTAAALVLGGTGPVGQRVARLLARRGAAVRVGSRQQTRAEAVSMRTRQQVPGAKLEPVAMSGPAELDAALAGQALVITAGAAGVPLLPRSAWTQRSGIKVLIDLNAVPPPGIEGVEVTDKGTERNGAFCYGAIGVGTMKMKIHKAAVARLFERNDQVLDAEEIDALAQAIQ
jgi:hypothetical protein